jgi:hypothetical protein
MLEKAGVGLTVVDAGKDSQSQSASVA